MTFSRRPPHLGYSNSSQNGPSTSNCITLHTTSTHLLIAFSEMKSDRVTSLLSGTSSLSGILFFFFLIFEFYLFIYFIIFFKKFIFIYLWLCWVFVSVRGLSLVAVSGGHSPSRCAGLSLSRPLLLRSTSSRRAGSVIVAHRPSCSAAGGIFPDQGSNPRPLHWQADSQPLHHQGSPIYFFIQ